MTPHILTRKTRLRPRNFLINDAKGLLQQYRTVPAAAGLSGCAAGCTTGSFDTKGFLAGGTLGANFQAGAFVLGVEADLDWTDINGSTATTNTVCPSCKTSNDWLGTARARVGYAADRVLIFLTGGAAFGNVEATVPAALHPPGGASNDTTQFGWTGGGGVEVALAQNWTAKIEYLYVDLENGSCTTACGAATGTSVAVSFKESLIRAGVNFKF